MKGLTPDRDLAFLHRLEQGGLRFRGRAVDFVGQQDIGEDRALDETKHCVCRARPLPSTCVPVMSDGIRSGVNWIRLKDTSKMSAKVLTISVLARPGTPSSRQCPRVKIAANICSIVSVWPTMTLASSARMVCWCSANSRSTSPRFLAACPDDPCWDDGDPLDAG